MPDPEGLPRPLLEENSGGEEGDKVNPGGGGTMYDSVRFPSASYFLGLPLFFFPNNSALRGVVLVDVSIVEVVVVVVVTARLMSPGLFSTTWGNATLLNGAGGESVSEFPSDPETVLSFSSIKICFKWTNKQSGFCYMLLEEESRKMEEKFERERVHSDGGKRIVWKKGRLL